eukprot:5614023-Pleurochrysis_carterae.AAC.1
MSITSINFQKYAYAPNYLTRPQLEISTSDPCSFGMRVQPPTTTPAARAQWPASRAEGAAHVAAIGGVAGLQQMRIASARFCPGPHFSCAISICSGCRRGDRAGLTKWHAGLQ